MIDVNDKRPRHGLRDWRIDRFTGSHTGVELVWQNNRTDLHTIIAPSTSIGYKAASLTDPDTEIAWSTFQTLHLSHGDDLDVRMEINLRHFRCLDAN